MKLSQLLQGVASYDGRDAEITGIATSSLKVKQGDLFICMQGVNGDGHAYCDAAIAAGAAAVVVSRNVGNKPVPVVKVSDTRRAYALISSNYFGNPSADLRIITVTGTNGKSTTAYVTAKLLEAGGYNVGLIGTMYYEYGGKKLPSSLTTPDPYELHSLFADMKNAGVRYVVMEFSAHAIYLEKLCGVCSDICIFTNLSQDHLDYFGDMKRYKAVKKSCFTAEYTRCALVNVDDACGREILSECVIPTVSYGLENPADSFAIDVEDTARGSSFVANIMDDIVAIDCRLYGRFNVYNVLAACTAARMAGVGLAEIADRLYTLDPPSGRFNVIESGGVKYVVDFAHTPDGLYNLLKEGRKLCKGKLVTVFGCGGDRDVSKRPIMGKIAGEMSDIVIVTSDNPRTESRQSIADDILTGVRKKNKIFVELDRSRAIALAVELSGKGDVVLIAGKGSESYIDENNVKTPYSDSGELNKALGL